MAFSATIAMSPFLFAFVSNNDNRVASLVHCIACFHFMFQTRNREIS